MVEGYGFCWTHWNCRCSPAFVCLWKSLQLPAKALQLPPSSNSIQETTFRWDNIQVRLLLSILLRPNSTAALSVQFLDPSAPFFALTFGLYPTISYQLLMFSRLFEIQLPWNTYFVFIYSGVVNSYTRAVMKRDGREKKLSCSHKTRKYKLFLGNCQSPFI